jgi:hypothetical protein
LHGYRHELGPEFQITGTQSSPYPLRESSSEPAKELTVARKQVEFERSILSSHILVLMTIITDFKEMTRLRKAREQPSLSFLSFSIAESLSDIRFERFPDIRHEVHIAFVDDGPLACIVHDESQATIYIHQLVNRHETPHEVINTIIKHELLHLCILPSFVGGKEVQHSDDFWAAEADMSPERHLAWLWVYTNFAICVKRRPRLERVDVLPGWRKAWCSRIDSIKECQKLIAPGSNGPRDIW